jgi:hypothetical protein
MKMLSRKRLLTAFGVLVLGLTMTSATHASGNHNRTVYLTFNRPVGLPGLALGSGTYAFELAEPTDAWSVVRVMSADRSKVYFSAFTIPIDRPAGMPRNQLMSFTETRTDAVSPIAAWWPLGESTGRQFVYQK